ncbi:MAG: hypothetical protein JWO36_4889 [Myxococcales bacterium]|nr:hypothetical protein [Myxococcales bacterium]
MKVCYALAGLAISSTVARAEVGGELSAGAGGDSSATPGFATTSGSITASLSRPATDILTRGAALVPPGELGGVWIFTGIDPDDHDSAGVSADGTLLVQADSQAARTAWFSTRAWARALGWQLEARALFQPTGDLRDRFWRSGRSIMQTNAAIGIPAMWSLGTRDWQLAAGAFTVDLGKRLAHEGAGWNAAGFDRDVSFISLRIQTHSIKLDLFTGEYTELGVATSVVGATTYGTSATAIDFDVAALTWRVSQQLAVTMRGGVAMRSPISPFQITGSAEMSQGPVSTTPDLGIELRRGTALDPDTNGYTASLGVGTWSRLDPTGHAVDAGYLATADADWRNGRYRLGGALQLGRLRRVLLGDEAPADMLPVGTRMVMGRGSLLAAVRVTPQIAVTSTAWVERSDRDDPRWLVPATGALATHAGADITAQWRFR